MIPPMNRCALFYVGVQTFCTLRACSSSSNSNINRVNNPAASDPLRTDGLMTVTEHQQLQVSPPHAGGVDELEKRHHQLSIVRKLHRKNPTPHVKCGTAVLALMLQNVAWPSIQEQTPPVQQQNKKKHQHARTHVLPTPNDENTLKPPKCHFSRKNAETARWSAYCKVWQVTRTSVATRQTTGTGAACGTAARTEGGRAPTRGP